MKPALLIAFFVALALSVPDGMAQAASPTFSTLYEFAGTPDVEQPLGPLVADKNGVLYGAGFGGKQNHGAIFSLTPPAVPGGAWTEKVLHNFGGVRKRDGEYPFAGLVVGEEGSIYGVDAGDKGTFGLAFELRAAGGSGPAIRILHTFVGGSDGASPYGGLIRGRNGVLYGTTIGGGGFSGEDCIFDGCGTIFSLTPPATGGPWAEAVLYSFTGANGDGASPSGDLVVDANGTLYGTCGTGGAGGDGTVYELAPPASPGGAWTETILHSFTGADGSGPQFGVALGSDGSLYGTARGEGSSRGVVFQLTPPSSPGGAWPETTLYSSEAKSGSVEAGVVVGSKGELYGTTTGGGAHVKGAGGTVFELVPPAVPGGAWKHRLLYSFPQVRTYGDDPGTVSIGSNGALYGTTTYGGTGGCKRGRTVVNCGTAFELVP